MSRSRRAIWSYLTTLALTAVSVLLALWSSPLLLGWLGRERFGAARTLTDWASHLMVLDLGLIGTMPPLLARALGRDDPRAVRALMRLGVRLFFGISLLCLAAGSALLLVLDRLVEVSPGSLGDLRAAWLVHLVALPAIWAVPHRALLDARQQSWRVSLYLTVQAVLITGLALLFAASGWGIMGQALAFGIGAVAFAIAVAWKIHRQGYGGTGPPDERDAEIARADVRKLAPSTWVLELCGRFSLLCDSIIVSAILGPTRVTVLFFTTRLAQLAQVQLQSVAISSWAAMAELDARGMRDVLNRRVVELTRLTMVLGLAVLVPIACYGRHFVTMWSHDPEVYGGDVVSALAAINALGVAIWVLWGWPFSGTGRAPRVVAPAVIGAVVNIALSLILTPRLGVAGPLWGTACMLFGVQLWWIAWRLRATFGTSGRELLIAVIVPLAWSLPFIFWCRFLATTHAPRGWIGLGFEMGGAALAYLAAAYRFVLTLEERASWHGRIAGMMPFARKNDAGS